MSTENYLFRRNICAIPTNALNKIFSLLHWEIVRYDGSETDCVEKSKYALLCKKEKARFPDDDEFALRSPTDLVFYLRDENEDTADEAGTRYELCRKYWRYALEYGPFCNVDPSKENCVNGFFGISGFSLCCVANLIWRDMLI